MLWAAELIQLGLRALCSPCLLLCLSHTPVLGDLLWLYTQLICIYSNFHNGTLKWEFDLEFIEIQSTYRLSSTALTTVRIL